MQSEPGTVQDHLSDLSADRQVVEAVRAVAQLHDPDGSPVQLWEPQA